jgi:hypothetical protein
MRADPWVSGLACIRLGQDQISGRYPAPAVTLLRGNRSLSSREARGVPCRVVRWSAGFRTAVDLGGEYSRKVPQQARTAVDPPGRARTLTCGCTRRWTCCLLFASRGPGVRVPLAPQVRSIIRTAGPGSTAAKYRNRGRARCRTCVRAGLRHRGRWPQISGLQVGFRATEQGERLGRAQRRLPSAQEQRPESAVSGSALAAHTEGQPERPPRSFMSPRVGFLAKSS